MKLKGLLMFISAPPPDHFGTVPNCEGQHPRHEAGWSRFKVHIMQKTKTKIKEVIMIIIMMKWSEAVFNVQYYKGLKAVWCYNVLNFLCLVVFETPHQEIALDSPNHYKIEKKRKKREKASNTRSLPVSVIVVLLSPFTVTFFTLILFDYFWNLTTRL